MEQKDKQGNQKLLDDFRQNWRTELSKDVTKPETAPSVKPGHSVRPKSSGSAGSLFDLKPGKITFQNQPSCSVNETSDNSRNIENIFSPEYSNPSKSESVYYPFSIADNFLSGSATERTCSRIPVRKEKVSEPCEKRKHKKYSTVSKKFKFQQTFTDLFSERQTGKIPDERLLDRLIADIDEITEIPFFDISIPREVAIRIFQYLNIKELCSCAQVSRSWCSLAEDELLWCRVCHRLGQETIYSTKEKRNWKEIVRHNVERQRILVSNWKGRIGKLIPLDHTKGKVLSAVDSDGSFVVAGYTNGHVKLWDLSTEDSCIFQPSNTSLIVNEHDAEGTMPNVVNSVETSSKYTVAAFSHGNVDIWSLDSGTQPMQTYKPNSQQFTVSAVCLAKKSPTLAVAYGPYIDLLHKARSDEEFKILNHVDCHKEVTKIKLFESTDAMPPVVLSTSFVVKMYHPKQPTSDSIGQSGHVTGHMTEIHNLIGAPVDVIDLKTDPPLLAVGLGSYGGFMGGFKIKVYDVHNCKPIQTLLGHTWIVSCINLVDSPPNMLVTGSGDRKLRIYDLRLENAVHTLVGHAHKVTCVQMDEWKVMSGSEDGFTCVWDTRMVAKLWDWHNRHPVRYCHYQDKHIVVGNVPTNKFPLTEEFEEATHRRYRGSVNVYNFLADLSTRDVPEICLSTYDQPDASKYNIGLAMPYDKLNF